MKTEIVEVVCRGKYPKVAININDSDYAAKSADQANWQDAVYVKGEDGLTFSVDSAEDNAHWVNGQKIRAVFI